MAGKLQHLNLDELKSLLAEVGGESDELRARNRLMVLVAFWHGLRATEVCAMEGRQVDTGYLDVQRLKGSRRTIQKLLAPADAALVYADELARRAQAAGPKGRVFPVTRFQFYRIVVAAGKAAGLPKHKRHPHCLKHTCAHTVIPAGMHVTRTWLGHESLSSTGSYLEMSDQEAGEAFTEAVKL